MEKIKIKQNSRRDFKAKRRKERQEYCDLQKTLRKDRRVKE